MRSGLSCNEPSFPRWGWLFEVSSKVRAVDLPVLVRGTVVEAEEGILAAMGGVVEGVKPGRKSFCCRKGEGNFDANAAATASATRLLISASCFFAICANCLSCLSWTSFSLVWRSCMAWLWVSNEISSDMTCVFSAVIRFYWRVKQL